MGGGGFSVDPAALRSAAGELGSIAGSLRKLQQSPSSASASASSALDNFVATSAIGGFGHDYGQALSDLASAVEQDSQTLYTNAKNYVSADTAHH